ncbi:hypothetical protein GCM10027570_40240 [Streptomonospora sediminis]
MPAFSTALADVATGAPTRAPVPATAAIAQAATGGSVVRKPVPQDLEALRRTLNGPWHPPPGTTHTQRVRADTKSVSGNNTNCASSRTKVQNRLRAPPGRTSRPFSFSTG